MSDRVPQSRPPYLAVLTTASHKLPYHRLELSRTIPSRLFVQSLSAVEGLSSLLHRRSIFPFLLPVTPIHIFLPPLRLLLVNRLARSFRHLCRLKYRIGSFQIRQNGTTSSTRRHGRHRPHHPSQPDSQSRLQIILRPRTSRCALHDHLHHPLVYR